jgi:hypothetical protein
MRQTTEGVPQKDDNIAMVTRSRIFLNVDYLYQQAAEVKPANYWRFPFSVRLSVHIPAGGVVPSYFLAAESLRAITVSQCL